jgi:hypothetical protein
MPGNLAEERLAVTAPIGTAQHDGAGGFEIRVHLRRFVPPVEAGLNPAFTLHWVNPA